MAHSQFWEPRSALAGEGVPESIAENSRQMVLRQKQHLRVLDDEGTQLIPGMPVEGYVKTGERTFLD